MFKHMILVMLVMLLSVPTLAHAQAETDCSVTTADSWLYWAGQHLVHGNTQEAIKSIECSLTLSPENIAAQYAAIEIYQHSGMTESAAAVAEQYGLVTNEWPLELLFCYYSDSLLSLPEFTIRLCEEVGENSMAYAKIGDVIVGQYLTWHSRTRPMTQEITEAQRFYTLAYNLDQSVTNLKNIVEVNILRGHYADALENANLLVDLTQGTEASAMRLRGKVYLAQGSVSLATQDYVGYLNLDSCSQASIDNTLMDYHSYGMHNSEFAAMCWDSMDTYSRLLSYAYNGQGDTVEAQALLAVATPRTFEDLERLRLIYIVMGYGSIPSRFTEVYAETIALLYGTDPFGMVFVTNAG